jgi:hypothetical protein
MRKTFSNQQLGTSIYMKLVLIMELRVVNVARFKNLTVTSAVFPHCNIHKSNWTFTDEKTHSSIDKI